MNILVIGSGGREHAVVHAFKRSEYVKDIFCAPGNAGIGLLSTCVPIAADDVESLASFAKYKNVDLTFVGGETTLALGIVDRFHALGLKIIGPVQAAAKLESSKAFAKDFMARHGVPTARYVSAHSAGFALLELESGDFGDETKPVVVKADGLAAGKGVVVAADRKEAINAINELSSLVGPAAVEKYVLEECLTGNEISLLMFCDGEHFSLMPPARDHKRIREGDVGPNTGGMGTFTDDSLIDSDRLKQIEEQIIKPTLKGCVAEGFPFKGILFLGLMMTDQGPKLLEYNVRFGDPEAQSILARLETDFVDICNAMTDGTLSETRVEWRNGSSATIVLAAEGYPRSARTGDVIAGLEEVSLIDNISVFHAGTARDAEGKFITAGGRVLGVTATGNDLQNALDSAYEAVNLISWAGMQYRRDIGTSVRTTAQ